MRGQFEHFRKLQIILICLLWLSGRSAFAGALYSVADIGAGTGDYGVTGFNNRGEISGNTSAPSYEDSNGFIYQNNQIVNLGTNFHTQGLNNNGQVVGLTTDTPKGDQQVLVRNSNGSIQEISSIDGVSRSLGINDAGQVAVSNESGVTIYSGNTSASVNFPWPNLGPPPYSYTGPVQSNVLTVYGITNSGSVVGASHPNAYAGLYPNAPTDQPFFTDSNNLAHVLFPMNSVQSGQTSAMSPNGWIVGIEGSNYFISAPGQDSPQILSFKNLTPSIDGVFFLSGINDKGVVVGSTRLSDGFAESAIAIDGAKVLDLNALIPASNHIHLDSAIKINDLGQILAKGHYLDSNDSTEHLFILSANAVPTPEPSTLATFSLPLIGAIIYLQKKKRSNQH